MISRVIEMFEMLKPWENAVKPFHLYEHYRIHYKLRMRRILLVQWWNPFITPKNIFYPWEGKEEEEKEKEKENEKEKKAEEEEKKKKKMKKQGP